MDYFYIDTDDIGGSDGKFLSVAIQAGAVGSLLDGDLAIYDDDGNEIGSATVDPDDGGVDAELRDLELGDYNRIVIAVEAGALSDEVLANNYMFSWYVSEDPLY